MDAFQECRSKSWTGKRNEIEVALMTWCRVGEEHLTISHTHKQNAPYNCYHSKEVKHRMPTVVDVQYFC